MHRLCTDVMKRIKRILSEDFVDFAEHTRNDIIVGVEIRFEEIRFPAVTVCNINPYKNSLARQTSSIKSALESFESAIDRTAGNEPREKSVAREKRSAGVPPLRPAHVYCRKNQDHYSVDPEGDEQCVLYYTRLDNCLSEC
ncbi:hypothetical protein ANCCEY_03089 [Ancylostoma ceylanicum]|uniref:Uncharacterized protein n=1 Tax=Ancylostoma ceylanicum TaxID=53326 RepID=A0A0D6M5Y9_9BILA|nr:hypothetical protein ANCCEY_03089 [Ancylostoma ceylanicum]